MKSNLKSWLWVYLLACLSSCTSEGDKTPAGKEAQSPVMVKAMGKSPMILITDRPYNLETPLSYFKEDYTPNDVFFVRWHLSNLPTNFNVDTFRLRISGNANGATELSLNDLKTRFEQVSLPALCVCSGNARSCFKPGVPGAQWVNGGMGNALWKGVRLKDILAYAKAKSNTKFVAFGGMDAPPVETVPDYVKTLDYAHAMDGEVMVAYEMNGAPLPILNGYPLKLVVPGWYATFWVGMLNDIRLYSDSVKTYWMDKAYLIPDSAKNGNEAPDALAKKMKPVSKIVVRSIFVSPEPNSTAKKGEAVSIEGLAFDGGVGIAKVEISEDKGQTWKETTLNTPLGKYSWRRFHYTFQPSQAGHYELYLKATTVNGDTQPQHHWNRSGYLRNEIEILPIEITE